MTTSETKPVYSFTPGGIIAVDDTAYQRGYDTGKNDGINTSQQNSYDAGYAAGVAAMTPDASTVRPVMDLLKLSTFQGMNDAEIQSIIDYRVKASHTDVQSNSYRVQAQAVIEDTQNMVAELSKNNADVLKYMLESTTHYVSPETSEVTNDTPRLEEV